MSTFPQRSTTRLGFVRIIDLPQAIEIGMVAKMKPNVIDMNLILPEHDLLWLVLDSLRFDVAEREWAIGGTPNLRRLIGESGWQRCHAPGNFTFPSHQSFFAGFLPTPSDPGMGRERLFAARFAGSESTGPGTKVFDEDNVIAGLRGIGFHTICIGGVGFFNKKTALSRVLPGYFDESHWREEFGVTCRDSPGHQCAFAAERIAAFPSQQRLLLFVNFSAVHQPNSFYLRDSGIDDMESHAAALRAIDREIPVLMSAFADRPRPVFHVTCSDHGTAYGESGFTGHRVSVSEVWDVPYAHGVVEKEDWKGVS